MLRRCNGTNIRKLRAQVHRATKLYKQKLQRDILQAQLSILKTQVHVLETQLYGGLKNPPLSPRCQQRHRVSESVPQLPPIPRKRRKAPASVPQLPPIPRKRVNKLNKAPWKGNQLEPVPASSPTKPQWKRLRKYFSPKTSKPKTPPYSPVSKQPVIPRKKSKLVCPQLVQTTSPRIENKPVATAKKQQFSVGQQELEARVKTLCSAGTRKPPRSKTHRKLQKILQRDHKKYLAAKKDYDQQKKSGKNTCTES